MKLSAKRLLSLSFLATLTATPAFAQVTFQHIIIVVQENRSVDNLFGDPNTTLPAGVNLSPVGYFNGNGNGNNPISLTPAAMTADFNPDHSNKSFVDTCNLQTNGACLINGDPTQVNCGGGSDCCTGQYQNDSYCKINGQWDYLWIKYVDNSTNQIQPYFDLANTYGFANYFFQTNEGPSFPAHQFLFGGTSAPSASSPLFSAENPVGPNNADGLSPSQDTGCSGIATTPQTVALIDYSGSETSNNPMFPCYDHGTLSDLLEAHHPTIGWGYYTESPYWLWTAPNAISHICEPLAYNGNQPYCDNSDFTSHVNTTTAGQILHDLGADTRPGQQVCNLPTTSVTWVIPDGAWSDHPNGNQGWGPSWVASIVNAVGGYNNSGQQLTSHCGYWANTAVLITWDDWGGWYDHVTPPSVIINQQSTWGSGYVYGFRVPLLVVSAYTGIKNSNETYSPYIWEPWNGQGTPPTTCPGNCMDFGSILKFVELNWGLPLIGNGNYADDHATKLDTGFFGLTTARPFQYISAPKTQQFFINYNGTPQPPDDD